MMTSLGKRGQRRNRKENELRNTTSITTRIPEFDFPERLLMINVNELGTELSGCLVCSAGRVWMADIAPSNLPHLGTFSGTVI
jgi:hypothetical protein